MNDPMAIMNVRVSILERKIDFLLKSLNLEYVHPIPEQMKPMAALLRAGKLKEAVEAYSYATGADPAGARAAIAELELMMR